MTADRAAAGRAPAAVHRYRDVYRHCLYLPAVHGAAAVCAAVAAGSGIDWRRRRIWVRRRGGCSCAWSLPLSLPGVAAGAALVFVPAIGEYVIPALLGGPQAQLIGKVLWEEFFANRDWPTASAVAVWLLPCWWPPQSWAPGPSGWLARGFDLPGRSPFCCRRRLRWKRPLYPLCCTAT